MVTLENLYPSDMKDILDWWNARQLGCIPASLDAKVENAMDRLAGDLHKLSLGKK